MRDLRCDFGPEVGADPIQVIVALPHEHALLAREDLDYVVHALETLEKGHEEEDASSILHTSRRVINVLEQQERDHRLNQNDHNLNK